jgi:hypothetical protein
MTGTFLFQPVYRRKKKKGKKKENKWEAFS